MKRFILDTDTFSHYLRNHQNVLSAIIVHLSDEVTTSIITVEELWDGWQSQLRRARTADAAGQSYQRLAETLLELKNWPIVSMNASSMNCYARLKKQKLNVGTNDLKIAAIALETSSIVVTQNIRDFSRIPGLQIENWVSH